MVYTTAEEKGIVPVKVSKRTQDLAEEEEAVKDVVVRIEDDVEEEEDSTFDIDKINITELANNLSEHITRPQNMGWLQRWWLDRRLPNDSSRVMFFQTYVDNLIKLNDSVTDVQHKLRVQPDILKSMIMGSQLEARQKIQKQIREHKERMDAIDDEAARRIIELNRIRAEVSQLEANATLTQLQGTLLRRIIDELDLSNITPQQAFVLVKALNPLAGKEIDLASQQLRS